MCKDDDVRETFCKIHKNCSSLVPSVGPRLLFAVINVLCIAFRVAIFDAKNKLLERTVEEAVGFPR